MVKSMTKLVIVESPTKAKTLARFLGDKYQIEATMGHVMDLPKSELGVDVKVVTRVYQRFREALYHLCELEACKLKEVTFTDVFKRDGIPIFNHRNEYVIKQFIDIYFGYVSP